MWANEFRGIKLAHENEKKWHEWVEWRERKQIDSSFTSYPFEVRMVND